MARPRPTQGPIGPSAYPLRDSERSKPSWFSLGGYFERKGKGKKGKRSSSLSQQKVSKGNRGIRNEQTIT